MRARLLALAVIVALTATACTTERRTNDMTNRDPRLGPVYATERGGTYTWCAGTTLLLREPSAGWNGKTTVLGQDPACDPGRRPR